MKNKCFMCERNSHEKVLVRIEKDWEENYVCVSCLPQVIHW